MTKAARRKQIHLVDGLVDPVDADKTWPRAAAPAGPRGPKRDLPASQPQFGPEKPAANGGRRLNAPPSTPSEAPKEAPDGVSSPSKPLDLDYWDARADHEWHKARLAEIELAREEGRILDAKEVQRELVEAHRALRDRLYAIPDRLAPSLAAQSDEAAVHAAILAAIHEALAQIDADFSAEPG